MDKIKADREMQDVRGPLDEAYMTIREIAKVWRCDRTTVVRTLERAGVKPYALGRGRNGLKRYCKAEVEAFMARSRMQDAGRGDARDHGEPSCSSEADVPR